MSMRDGDATIEAAIRSVIWQTFEDWELILIDDGSRDHGAARAAKFGDPRIRIIRHEQSRGLAFRLNEAIGLARGEFIARMDVDDICYPERLATQLSVLQSDPRIDLLSSRGVVFRRQGEIVGVISAPTTHEEIVAHPYKGMPFLHPAWLGKAAWFRRHHYDETLLTAEDQELLLRTAACSRFATVDKILLGYRKERISLSKGFWGRLTYSRIIWRHARQSGAFARAAAEIGIHFVKFIPEIAAIIIGVDEWLLKQKFLFSMTLEETARWRTIWNAISSKIENAAPSAN